MKKLLVVLAVLLFCSPAFAQTYYVALGETDPDEDGTITHPFDCYTDVTLANNITILFKKGTSKTIVGNYWDINGKYNISIGTYGEGAKPVLDGRKEINGWTTSGNWTNTSGSIWRISTSGNAFDNPQRLWVDDVEWIEIAGATPTANNRWGYASSFLYVYSATNPATTYSSMKGLNNTHSVMRILTSEAITVDGLEFQGAYYHSLLIARGINIEVKNCDFYNFSNAIVVRGSETALAQRSHSNRIHSNYVDGVLLEANKSKYLSHAIANPYDGIILECGVYNTEVYSNTIKGLLHTALRSQCITNQNLDFGNFNNHFYLNTTDGSLSPYSRAVAMAGERDTTGVLSMTRDLYFYLNTFKNHNIRTQIANTQQLYMYLNLFENTTLHTNEFTNRSQAILVSGWNNYADTKEIYFHNNIIVDTAASAIVIGEGDAPNLVQDILVANNIIINAGIDPGTATDEYITLSSSNRSTKRKIFNNIFYGTPSPTILYSNHGTTPLTVAQFNALNGTYASDEISGNQHIDPLLDADYSLLENSPAIDEGTTATIVGMVGTFTDYFGYEKTFAGADILNVGFDFTRDFTPPEILSRTLGVRLSGGIGWR